MTPRWPEKLSTEVRYSEWVELRFQREVNRHRYLTWETIGRKVADPGKRYKVRDAHTWDILRGDEVLDQSLQRIRNGWCSLITRIEKAAPGEELPLEMVWMMSGRKDRATGRPLVAGHENDPWDMEWLTSFPQDSPHLLTNKSLEHTAREVIKRRSGEAGITDPNIQEAVVPTVAQAFQAGFHRNMLIGRNQEAAAIMAWSNAVEALDRAYHLELIRRAGVDLNQHPEFRSMQTYFDLGMMPPGHREMAEVIIRIHGAEKQ